MVKIKLLICLLLASTAAQAGVTLTWTEGSGMADEIPIGTKDELTNVPPGWSMCIATSSFFKPAAGGRYVVGDIACYTNEALNAKTGCVATPGNRHTSSSLILQGSDSTYRSFILTCAYP